MSNNSCAGIDIWNGLTERDKQILTKMAYEMEPCIAARIAALLCVDGKIESQSVASSLLRMRRQGFVAMERRLGKSALWSLTDKAALTMLELVEGD